VPRRRRVTPLTSRRVPAPGSAADRIRRDMARALRIMQAGETRQAAAKEVGRSPSTLSRYLPLRKEGNRWVLTDAETYGNTKPLPVRVTPTRSELVVVPAATGAERERASDFGRAVRHYFATGETDQLERFEGQTIGGLEFETRIDELDELYQRGELDPDAVGS
jgi:hypothetical protein